MRILGTALLALALAGCGGTASTTTGTPGAATLGGVTPVPDSVGLTGRVVDENGAGVAGVTLVAEERTVDFKGTAVSQSDGSYRLSLPRGVYDVGLDSADAVTATCFYGPVSVPVNGLRQDFTLQPRGGRADGTCFGRIFLQPGVPAARRQVTLRPGQSVGDEIPEPVTVTTDSTGAFELQLTPNREAVGLDVEVYDSPGPSGLDEFIDVATRGKPCFVQFVTEEIEVENRLRNNEADDDLPPETQLEGGVALKLTARFSADTIVNGAGNTFGRLRGGPITADGDAVLLASCYDGYLPEKQANALSTPVRDYLYPQVRVSANGDWWYTYAIDLVGPAPSSWTFQDETRDRYFLGIYTGSKTWHRVNYDSRKPAIQEITFLL